MITIEAFEKDEHGLLVSRPHAVQALGGAQLRFELDGYEGDPHPEDFLQAVTNVLGATRSLLLDATPYVHQYCREMVDLLGEEAPQLDVTRPEDVWKHVELGDVLAVSRDHDRGRVVYVSLECECAWEVEHGLQLVFRNGREISKVSPFDGHVSNASAFGDDALEGVVYRSMAG